MLYIEKTLSNGEIIKEIVKLHWFAYLRNIGITIIFLFFFIFGFFCDGYIIFLSILILIFNIYSFLILYTIEMVVTNKRVIYKYGILSIKTEELKNKRIESVKIKQSILGRILGYADIYFTGTGISKVNFYYIEQPYITKSNIDAIIDEA